MRDPGRLDKFYEEVKEIHKKHFPDWRYGQLCSNFFGWLWNDRSTDMFFPEEPDMLRYLREYVEEYRR